MAKNQHTTIKISENQWKFPKSGEDITNEVVDNVLTASIPADATLLVTFKNQGYDINQDGEVTVADVVSLVNYILSIE